MWTESRPARINVKVVVILVVLVALMAGGMVTAYFVRRLIIAREAMSQAKQALKAEDYRAAVRHMGLYLHHYPEDQEWLAKFAETNLLVQPRTRKRQYQAAEAYRRLLRLRPNDERTIRELLRIYEKLQNHVEMAYICRQRLEQAPDDLPAALSLGRALLAMRKYDESRKVLEDLIKRAPNEPEAYAMLSIIAQQLPTEEALALAKQRLDEGIANNPQSAKLLAYRARLRQSRLLQMDEALVDLEAATAMKPTDPGVHLLMFEVWMMRGELDRAAGVLQDIRALDDVAMAEHHVDQESLELAVMKAQASLLLRRHQTEEGLALAKAAMERLQNEQWFEFLPLAVDLYLQAGDTAAARTAIQEYHDRLQKLREGTPPTSDQLALMDALIAAADNDAYRVINLLEPVVARRPNLDRPWKLLAAAYADVGQQRRALRIWEEYLTRWPLDPTVNTLLVNAYINERRWTDALKLVRKAQPIMPKDLEKTLLDLKLAELKAKALAVSYQIEVPETLDDILAELDKLRELHPGVVEIHTIRAFIRVYQGADEAAVQELQSAVERSPDSLLAMMQLVDLYSRLGRQEEAIALSRRAIEQHPADSVPYVVLGNLLRSADRLPEAREVYRTAESTLTGEEQAKVRLAHARLLLLTDERVAGLDLMRTLAKDRPEDVPVRSLLLALPEVQANQPETDQLVAELQRIEGDRGLNWRLETARSRIRSGTFQHDRQGTVDLLKYCIDRDGDWAEPIISLGGLYERMGENTLAEDTYRQFINLHPSALQVADRYLNMLQSQKRYLEAWNVLRRLPEQVVRASAHRANIALAREEFDEALDALQLRVEADPKDATARALLGWVVYIHRRDAEQALRLLAEAHELDPDLILAVSTRVSILHAEGRNTEILPLLQAEVDRRQDFAAHLMRGEFLELTKQLDLAEQDFQKLTTFADRTERGYELLGDFYQRNGQPQKAVSAWEAGLQKHPSSLELQRRMVRALLISQASAEQRRGRQMLNELLNLVPNDTELLYYKALMLLIDRRLETIREAREILQKVVQADPQHVNAWLRLIELAQRRGDIEDARETVVRAMGANPRSAPLLLAQAEVEAAAGHPLIARSSASRAIEMDANNVEARAFLVRNHLEAGELDAAEAMAREALRIAPESETANLTYVRVLGAREQRAELIRHLEGYIQTPAGQKSIEAQTTLAEYYRLDKNFEQAGRVLDRIETTSADQSEVFIVRMRWLADQGRYDEVLKQLADRQDERGDESEVLMEGGRVLAYAPGDNHHREALRLFNKFITLNPDRIDGYLGLAYVAEQLGEVQVAETAYRQVIDLVPFHRDALNNLAMLLARDLKKFDEAIVLADKAVKRYPRYPQLLDTRGYINLQLGRFADARRDLQSCLELAGQMPEVRAYANLNLARLNVQERDLDRATAHFEQVRQIDDEHHILQPKDRQELDAFLSTRSQAAPQS